MTAFIVSFLAKSIVDSAHGLLTIDCFLIDRVFISDLPFFSERPETSLSHSELLFIIWILGRKTVFIVIIGDLDFLHSFHNAPIWFFFGQFLLHFSVRLLEPPVINTLWRNVWGPYLLHRSAWVRYIPFLYCLRTRSRCCSPFWWYHVVPSII